MISQKHLRKKQNQNKQKNYKEKHNVYKKICKKSLLPKQVQSDFLFSVLSTRNDLQVQIFIMHNSSGY